MPPPTTDKELEAESQYANRRINEQSILIENVDIITNKLSQNIQTIRKYETNLASDIIKDVGPKPIRLLSEQPEVSINKLYNLADFINDINKLNSADMSNLVPYIKIFKIYEETPEQPVQIVFNNFYPKSAIESILSNGSDRGYQANLVSMDVASQGKDPGTMYLYTVKMKFIFDSVQTLFNPDSLYLELFNPPKKNINETRRLDSKYYRLMIDFGWEVNLDLPENIINKKQLINFAQKSRTKSFINYVKHTLNINEDGSVAIDIEYISSIEAESYDTDKINLLATSEIKSYVEIQDQIDSIEEDLKKQNITIKYEPDNYIFKKVSFYDDKNKEIKNSVLGEQLTKLYEKRDEMSVSTIKDVYNVFIKRINSLYSINGQSGLPVLYVNKELYNKRQELLENNIASSSDQELNNFQQYQEILRSKGGLINCVRLDLTGQGTYDNLTLEEIFKKEEELSDSLGSKTLSDTNNTPVPIYPIVFFTFGDLIRSLNLNIQEFKVFCTNMVLTSFGDGKIKSAKEFKSNQDYKLAVDNGVKLDDSWTIIENKKSVINIADLPISLALFRSWFLKHITAKNVQNMTLRTFLDACINDLFPSLFQGENKDFIPKQNVTIKYFLDSVDIAKDKLLKNIINLEKEDKKNYALVDPESVEHSRTNNINKKNIIIFYTSPNVVTRKMNVKKDIEDGIPHFFYGASTGIVQKMSFRQEQFPYALEANMQTQIDAGNWKPGLFLRGKYNVVIDVFGTVQFKPGSMLYIHPSFTGVKDVLMPIEYGIGGYFVLVSIKSKVESGRYMTSLECIWVAKGDGYYSELSAGNITVLRTTKSLEQIRAEEQAEQEFTQNTINQVGADIQDSFEGPKGKI